MSKTFRSRNPAQTLPRPPSPVLWLPKNHLVFILLDLAAELNLGEIHIDGRQNDPRDEKAREPRMMVMFPLYAYGDMLPISRLIETACWEDAAFRVRTRSQQPDHCRISDCRRSHPVLPSGCFVQQLKVSQLAGLVSLGYAGLDGTTIRACANASKPKAMSHERMFRSERR